ncbi:hypothetical protein RSAG8_01603, partial [Rhizoctonia solani AG-8 WAC10335]
MGNSDCKSRHLGNNESPAELAMVITAHFRSQYLVHDYMMDEQSRTVQINGQPKACIYR